MTIAVDLGRKANKQTNKQTSVHVAILLSFMQLIEGYLLAIKKLLFLILGI